MAEVKRVSGHVDALIEVIHCVPVLIRAMQDPGAEYSVLHVRTNPETGKMQYKNE